MNISYTGCQRVNCLMLVLVAFIVSKVSNEVELKKNVASAGPGLLQWCSIKCCGNDVICWQSISVKATKHLPGSLF